jgi:hypothetical protein
VNTCDLLSDLDRPHAGKQGLNESAATDALFAAGAVHAVQELADGDDADRPILRPDCVLDLWIGDTTLEVDEHVGVD